MKHQYWKSALGDVSNLVFSVSGKGDWQWIRIGNKETGNEFVFGTRPEDQVAIAEAILPEGFEVVEKGKCEGRIEEQRRMIVSYCKHLSAANSDITDLKAALAHARGCTYDEIDTEYCRYEQPEPATEALPTEEELAAMTNEQKMRWALDHQPSRYHLTSSGQFRTDECDTWDLHSYGVCELFRDLILAERKAEAEAQQWSEPIGEMGAQRKAEVADRLGYFLYARPTRPSETASIGDAWFGVARGFDGNNSWPAPCWEVAIADALSQALRAAANSVNKCGCFGGHSDCIWLGEGPMPKETPECGT